MNLSRLAAKIVKHQDYFVALTSEERNALYELVEVIDVEQLQNDILDLHAVETDRKEAGEQYGTLYNKVKAGLNEE